MDLILYRGTPTATSLPGEMFIAGSHACYTLERPGYQIPSGTYKITLHYSPHFQRLMPILMDVPGREDILIHWGSYPWNSEGCILVGKQRDLSSGEIFHTQEMFNELFLPIEAAVETEGCSITVLDYQELPTQQVFLTED